MKNILRLPLEKSLTGFKTGDVIYLEGCLFTGRDEVYRRVIEEKEELPVSLKGSANYHAGPIVKKSEGGFELVSIGPTSSARMEKWAADFIEKTGVKILIGKGGMGEKTAGACKANEVIHCIYPGGCAVLGASLFQKIENVYWPQLGMAECVWEIKTQEFGPLIVSIDTQGNNLFADNEFYYKSNIERELVSVHKVGYFADRPCIFSPKGCENTNFKEVCL